MISARCHQCAGKWLLIVACILLLCSFVQGEAGAEGSKGGCEVVSFDAYEESQAILTPAGDYKVTARRQCANATARNIYGSAVSVDEILFTAVFGNAKSAEAGFDLTGKDMKKKVSPSETYEGAICFEGDSPILILNCEVK